jgi:hypothetical protein
VEDEKKNKKKGLMIARLYVKIQLRGKFHCACLLLNNTLHSVCGELKIKMFSPTKGEVILANHPQSLIFIFIGLFVPVGCRQQYLVLSLNNHKSLPPPPPLPPPRYMPSRMKIEME